MNRFEWTNATSVSDAIGQLGEGAALKAGGVDLMDLLKERLVSPSRLVNLRTVPGLDRIDEGKDGLRVGPMVTLARLGAEPIVQRRYRALADAAGDAATPQIRNAATIGGNLVQRPRCWYFRQEAFPCRKKGGARCFAQEGENAYHAIFDNHICAAVHPSSLATALVALRGAIEITGPAGAREVPLEGFFTAPEQGVTRENTLGDREMITAIRVPAPSAGATSAYAKQGEKESFDWPLVDVAVSIERQGDRVARASVVLGAVAHHPWRAAEAEKRLAGRALDEATAREAADAAVLGATPLRDNGYKIAIAKAVVRRTILAAGGAR